jgi:hypothetical protein
MERSPTRATPVEPFGTFRHAGLVLVFLLLCTIAAFWRSYLTTLHDLPEHFGWTLHAHAVLMGGWVILLCVQAWLVRKGKWHLHRFIGRTSFLYVSVTIVSGVVTMRESMLRGPGEVTMEAARDATFQHMMLASFALTWALGIMMRRRPTLHVRYMISTVFAIGSAIFFRIFFFLVPGYQDYDRAAHANFVAMGLLLAALLINDWRLGLRRSPYWVITALLFVQFLAYRLVSDQSWWLDYCNRIAGFQR